MKTLISEAAQAVWRSLTGSTRLLLLSGSIFLKDRILLFFSGKETSGGTGIVEAVILLVEILLIVQIIVVIQLD